MPGGEARQDPFPVRQIILLLKLERSGDASLGTGGKGAGDGGFETGLFFQETGYGFPAQGPEAQTFGALPFYEGDLSLYTDFVHPAGWDRKSVRAFLDREFRRHPSIAPILRRDPPFFTSNHAPFISLSDATVATGSRGASISLAKQGENRL